MTTLHQEIRKLLFDGTVIPAHPLALKQDLTLDEHKQRSLTRYYMASGAGGIAIGVHTTQFEIRNPEVNLYEKVLEMTADEVEKGNLNRPFIKVAGICGLTKQALNEARIAVKYGYDLGLVSMAAFKTQSETEIIEHVKAVSEVIPVFGFYLQAAIGGRIFSYAFWQQFAEIPNVYAVKIAAFNRYQTLDVVRAVCHSSRNGEIALYTGNDDNIIADLLTPYRFEIHGKTVEKRFVGGLLGHWAVWTEKAVKLLESVKSCVNENYTDAEDMLALNIAVTDMNAAIFDPAHHFHGCITGVHEVLRRQGLMEGIWTLNPEENLSPGQFEEITRVIEAYPHLVDDDFVHAFLEKEIRIS
ncbi:dihydrodipicolinate synthase family protein [Dyadobacter sediminis]|uniref:Dihydrodipicolinate synthase family protein n=1 Tax=Dyadobacter sediminis TaxID=1493691 RepID=A0A5R9KKZ0_9BACT|nr:dihydrodipicolinate synthase family protein [Dyadobacter sediminis]TLU96881.1 dihydrodipicolinate synthase family protein [Dyadobacter sediminis]GGB85912.1 dihydrodipicolinate synthetase [Dyadobacter sediminis]